MLAYLRIHFARRISNMHLRRLQAFIPHLELYGRRLSLSFHAIR